MSGSEVTPQAPGDAGQRAGSLVLVSCVSMKRAQASMARDLYCSPWFVKARAFAELGGSPWFILSALHGLLDPDAVIEPYEQTLPRMRVGERRAWAKRVLSQVQAHLVGKDRVVMLAGEGYREFLQPLLEQEGLMVDVPMAGLKIGEQLSWLTRQIPRKP